MHSTLQRGYDTGGPRIELASTRWKSQCSSQRVCSWCLSASCTVWTIYVKYGFAYKDGAAQESDEKMVVIDADAVHGHTAVMVVAHTAPVANRAVVHAGELEHLALLAETPPLNPKWLWLWTLKVGISSGMTLKLLGQVVVGKYKFLSRVREIPKGVFCLNVWRIWICFSEDVLWQCRIIRNSLRYWLKFVKL